MRYNQIKENKPAKIRKIKPLCIYCGVVELKKNAQTYCSNTCSAQHQRQLLCVEWLMTGIIPNNVTSHIGKDHFVREYVRNRQSNLCAICGCEPIHNKLPLVFRLDHIDGHSEDNKESNLRLICPNCDTQLPTFGSKNRGNGRKYRKARYDAGKSY